MLAVELEERLKRELRLLEMGYVICGVELGVK